jgi:hypothetical protein
MKGFKTITEIAAELGIARGTVKQAVMRAPIRADKMGLKDGHWVRFFGPVREEKIKKLFKKDA